ncbi:Hypothetical predicted protein [Mytilus galloprovincialis]|uniref:Uncharacterized protein n=1 Tax=Mytilus galloprovincialis TaxID=29158 RepID=A0A8B6C6I8_MYTGA|nr:Hypothetical predicted protein [Mytilus galloprovincialis]
MEAAKYNRWTVPRLKAELVVRGAVITGRRADPIDSSLFSKDTEQISYTPTRPEDPEELRNGVIFDGIPYTFQLRFFSGDGPARQFEAGQQRGGNYSCLCGVHSKDHINLECCFKQTPSYLEDRRAVFLKGSHLERIADYLIPGYNIWWHYNGTELVFHDSVDEPEFRMQGPDTANFRSTSLKKERAIIDDIWQTSVDKPASSELVFHYCMSKQGKMGN